MAKVIGSAAVPRSKSAAKPSIPERPTYWFRGAARPAAFNDGVDLFLDLVRGIEDTLSPANDDECADLFAGRIGQALQGDGERQLGFAATFAYWLAEQRHCTPDSESFVPFCTLPGYRVIGGREMNLPGARSRFFDVDGVAVTVSPELTCYAFGARMCETFDLSLVRERGREISRDKFNALRAKAPTRPGLRQEDHGEDASRG